MDIIFRGRRIEKVHQISTILICFLINEICGVEEIAPEYLLPPRHFNHHPYEFGKENSGRQIDLLPFQATPEPNFYHQNFVFDFGDHNTHEHPIDDHPYQKVVKKQRFRLIGRFDPKDNRVNPGVYEGLSKHAAKVLTKTPSQLAKDYTLSSLQDQKKNYAFSYKVVDHLTGDDFSHSQSQTPKATNGEYRVKLPDGRIQIVSYTADKNGYKADVKYTEPSQTQQSPTPIFDYQYDGFGVSGVQKQTLSNPGYYPESGSSPVYPTVQVIPTHKVEINVNADPAGYDSSTLVPYSTGFGDYTLSTVAPTQFSHLKRFSQVYVNTPKYQVQHRGHHHAGYYKK